MVLNFMRGTADYGIFLAIMYRSFRVAFAFVKPRSDLQRPHKGMFPDSTEISKTESRKKQPGVYTAGALDAHHERVLWLLTPRQPFFTFTFLTSIIFEDFRSKKPKSDLVATRSACEWLGP